MVKKSFLLLFLISALAFSQQEASVWYFGVKAGLKFNTDGTVTELLDGQLDTLEGCATIADSNGNLLFYTDGRNVWDMHHIKMPNGDNALGTGLFGDSSSTQSAIIVPNPTNANIYYIFTVDEPQYDNAQAYPNAFTGSYLDGTSTPLDDDGYNNGLNYSIVDLSIVGSNGSIGDVSSRNNPLVSYDPNPSGEGIKYKCSEKITAVLDGSGTGFWVITQFVDSFYSFKVSGTGVSTTPIISVVPPVIPTSGYRWNGQGYLKASPDGSRLAIAHSENVTAPSTTYDVLSGSVYVYDFDKNTGVVSNPINVISGVRTYGVEFSKSSNLLYVSYESKISYPFIKLCQFDLQSVNIPNSKVLLYSTTEIAGALQLAIDNKIYFSPTGFSLTVINTPDVQGIGCNVVEDQQTLTNRATYGLPPFITSFFNVAFSAQHLCFGDTTQFTLNTTQPINSIVWNFGDGFSSNSLSPTHQYVSAGSYVVTVTATTVSGTTTTNTKSILISNPPVAYSISNQTLCGTAAMNYDLSLFSNTALGAQSSSVYGVAYFASMSDLVSHNHVLNTVYHLPLGNSTFYVKVYNLSNVNCYDVKSFTVSLFSQPNINTPIDSYICDDISNDGLELFNLQNFTSTILGSQNASDYTVTYHATQNDADINSNPLVLNYQNTSNPQTIFARIENKLNVNCKATTSFKIGLYKLPKANKPTAMSTCDDKSNDGVAFFDLATKDFEVLGGQPASDFEVYYYEDINQANAGTNAITTNYYNIINPQTIFVRIQNKFSSSCFDITSFQLNVRSEPVIVMNDLYTLCEGKSITVSAPNGFSSYLWSNGGTTANTILSLAGNYWVKVTKDYGDVICESTKNLNVINSNVASITNIETSDWTEVKNSITIVVTGDGVYEYSLDNIHFQNSNQFEGLMSGQYLVYVRDKNGCGTVTDEVFLLMYPKFFTPNGDGVNDYWHILFSNNEPSIKIKILDRYGRIIKELNGLNAGWDGNCNGLPMISDDYWFVVTRANGKEYKGHFAMKR